MASLATFVMTWSEELRLLVRAASIIPEVNVILPIIQIIITASISHKPSKVF